MPTLRAPATFSGMSSAKNVRSAGDAVVLEGALEDLGFGLAGAEVARRVQVLAEERRQGRRPLVDPAAGERTVVREERDTPVLAGDPDGLDALRQLGHGATADRAQSDSGTSQPIARSNAARYVVAVGELAGLGALLVAGSPTSGDGAPRARVR